MAQFKSIRTLANEIRYTLSTDIEFAKNFLHILYEYQLEDERFFEHTRYSNRVGFNKADANILTRICKAGSRELTEDENSQILHRLPKYAGQLIRRKLKNGELKKEHGYYNF